VFVVAGIDRVNPAEHHRVDFLESRQGGRRVARVGDGVPHLDLQRALDIGGHIAGLAAFEPFAHVRLRIKAAHFLDLHILAGMEQLDLHSRLQLAIEHAHVGDHAPVSVEIAIKPQRLQGGRAGRFRRRDPLHDGLEDLINTDAFLGAGQNGRIPGNRQDILQLPLRLRDIRVRQVYFVYDRDNGEVLLHGQVHIGHGLRLDPLRGIHDQQRPLAGAQTPGDFVGKIHVPGRINQVQFIGLPVPGLVKHRHRVRFDRDAALLFQIHGIEQLILHLARGDGARSVQQPIRERRLPVINMSNDAKISNMRRIHLSQTIAPPRQTPPGKETRPLSQYDSPLVQARSK